MSEPHTADVSEILDRISDWAVADRLQLAARL